MFADDTTVLGRIKGNNESVYRDEVQHLVMWCDNNNLVLTALKKPKEINVDFGGGG